MQGKVLAFFATRTEIAFLCVTRALQRSVSLSLSLSLPPSVPPALYPSVPLSLCPSVSLSLSHSLSLSPFRLESRTFGSSPLQLRVALCPFSLCTRPRSVSWEEVDHGPKNRPTTRSEGRSNNAIHVCRTVQQCGIANRKPASLKRPSPTPPAPPRLPPEAR